jgi:hypothetical protein
MHDFTVLRVASMTPFALAITLVRRTLVIVSDLTHILLDPKAMLKAFAEIPLGFCLEEKPGAQLQLQLVLEGRLQLRPCLLRVHRYLKR